MSMAWSAFYWRDYIANTGHLSLQEHGAYLLLMAHYYMTGNPIPANAEQLHRICRCTTDAERHAVDSVLAQFFILQDGEHHHERIDDELKKSNEISEKRSKAARKRQQADSNCNANAPANAEQKHTQPQPQPQEDLLGGDKSPPSPVRSKPVFDWDRGRFDGISETQIQAWRTAYPAVQVETEINKAAAWQLSNPKNRKKDCLRFINNWLSRVQERAPRVGGGSSRPAKFDPHEFIHGNNQASGGGGGRIIDGETE